MTKYFKIQDNQLKKKHLWSSNRRKCLFNKQLREFRATRTYTVQTLQIREFNRSEFKLYLCDEYFNTITGYVLRIGFYTRTCIPARLIDFVNWQ